MQTLVIVVHVIVAVVIVGLVLLQQGKGADAGASFGAGASQTMFGSSSGGGNFLVRATTVAATLFFVTSLTLAIFARDNAGLGSTDALPATTDGLPSEEQTTALSGETEPSVLADPVVDTAPAGDLPQLDETPAADDDDDDDLPSLPDDNG